tara:strand:- start:162 stop:1145 length:984 start_codon:yes stop_codon:yes gene_type:complete
MKNVKESQTYLTIITATYNGGNEIKRLYKSILKQNYKNFEWIIIDDGSKNYTLSILGKIMENKEIDITLIRQSHAHKKTAINKGILKAKYELSVIIDDDDYFVDNAFFKINKYWQSIPIEKRNILSGITFNSITPDGKIVGDLFPKNGIISSEIELRSRYKVTGDKFFVKKTNIMSHYLFDESIEGYVPESMLLNYIERDFPTLYINDSIRVYDLTRQKYKDKLRGTYKINTCRGRFYEYECIFSDTKWEYLRKYKFYFLKICINFIRFYLIRLVSFREWKIKRMPLTSNIPFLLLSAPIAFLVFIADIYNYLNEDIYSVPNFKEIQ